MLVVIVVIVIFVVIVAIWRGQRERGDGRNDGRILLVVRKKLVLIEIAQTGSLLAIYNTTDKYDDEKNETQSRKKDDKREKVDEIVLVVARVFRFYFLEAIVSFVRVQRNDQIKDVRLVPRYQRLAVIERDVVSSAQLACCSGSRRRRSSSRLTSKILASEKVVITICELLGLAELAINW